MIVGFFRVLATGALLLTTTTTLVQPAGASLSSTELSQQRPTEVTVSASADRHSLCPHIMDMLGDTLDNVDRGCVYQR